MSINYYDLSQPPQFWPHTAAAEPPEFLHMDRLFEKPLTPSDVGKLNRLVIPKQHAEKHFPLNSGADSGLLLAFEDEIGKPWRFRYSYWNSSQSYVLTKGWSRFVKEKHLDAGDVVVFARHRLDPSRFFIGWRRRAGNPVQHYHHPIPNPVAEQQQTVAGGGNSRWLRLFGVNMECANESDSGESSQYCYSNN